MPGCPSLRCVDCVLSFSPLPAPSPLNPWPALPLPSDPSLQPISDMLHQSSALMIALVHRHLILIFILIDLATLCISSSSDLLLIRSHRFI